MICTQRRHTRQRLTNSTCRVRRHSRAHPFIGLGFVGSGRRCASWLALTPREIGLYFERLQYGKPLEYGSNKEIQNFIQNYLSTHPRSPNADNDQKDKEEKKKAPPRA
jgi:hypothetical protein